MRDLHSFLEQAGSAVWRLGQDVALDHELTALQHLLDQRGQFPVLLASKLRSLDGAPSAMPVVTNLTASRTLTAQALGIADARQAAQWFAQRSAAGIEPAIVEPGEAPVQQLVMRGEQASLLQLPVLTQHELEPGPYLTAAHATTFDPDSGVDNTAIQRCWVKSARQMSWFPYPASHNVRNLRKFWARGAACPVAFWIGHHPAVLLGTQSKLNYPQSHWSAAGGVLGEPLRLVPSVLHGASIMVPADAEIVIEGFAPPHELAADGPFGEYTGYLGAKVQAPIVEVGCITRRRDAIYHDYGSGLTDMLVPDNMAMEGKLYAIVKAVAPSLINVHVPTEGRRFHAYLQFGDASPSEVRDGLVAALAYRRVKTVVALDRDVDIFSPQSVLWAIATRVQWSRDSIVIDGLSGSNLDPSLTADDGSTSKIGIDATLPRSGGKGAASAPTVATVPEATLRKLRRWLDDPAPDGWPRN